ncbi:hypothetical protein [Aestuariivivens sediminicola]|uniref:hypothetical protein n=1 Tax=Aestuariivivens sediminicola TaxID=2913560 RepID=UPI001F55E186|nr:hypothetical protein [Aestuariivivens sediminicola]
MKNILWIIILIPFLIIAQEKQYRIVTKKGETIIASKIRERGNKLDILEVNGNSKTIRNSSILYMSEDIEGLEYFKFTPSGFTEFVKVKFDSVSKKELLDHTMSWIKEKYVLMEYGSGIKIEEILEKVPEFDGHILYKAEIPNKSEPIFAIDTLNSVIKIFGYNSDTYFYRIDITFRNSQYEFDPVSLWYYSNSNESGSFFGTMVNDLIFGERWEKNELCISNPKNCNYFYFDRKGKPFFKEIELLIINIEHLFNELHSSLYNYIHQKMIMKNGDITSVEIEQ